MERTLTYHIRETEAGLRIEQFLRRKGYSAQNLTQIKQMPICATHLPPAMNFASISRRQKAPARFCPSSFLLTLSMKMKT